MIIGVKLEQVSRVTSVFNFATNDIVGTQAFSNFFGRPAEVLLQLSAHHRVADKLEIMRQFQSVTSSGRWPKLHPIKKIGGGGGPSKVIRVTNPTLALAYGAYVHWDGNCLTDGTIHVDLINGSSYNLAPTEYEVIG